MKSDTNFANRQATRMPAYTLRTEYRL